MRAEVESLGREDGRRLSWAVASLLAGDVVLDWTMRWPTLQPSAAEGYIR